VEREKPAAETRRFGVRSLSLPGKLGSATWFLPKYAATHMVSHSTAILVLVSLVASGSFGQTSVATSATPTPLYSAGPTTDYKAAFPNSSDVLRFRRGERYNISDSTLPELGEDSEFLLAELPLTHSKKDPMPFDTSDAVVVGTVTAGQSYLSNDRRDIYSEFNVKLGEIIQNSDAVYLRANDSIDIQRKGGVIRLPSGKVLTRAVVADSMPQIGSRYLLFLKYDQSTQDYAVLNGYQLAGNEVYRLDDLSWNDSRYPELVHPLRSEGVSEYHFLAVVKSMMLSQKGRAN
jgi:hypothetical protein